MIPVQSFELTTKIIFGLEAIREIPMIGQLYGGKVMIVTGKSSMLRSGALSRITGLLRTSGFNVTHFAEVEPEPSLETAAKGLEMARERQIDWIIGLGGGSALDVAKVIAGLIDAEHSVEYYFGGGKVEVPGIPFVAVPTTSGSGAEVTFNAVLTDTGQKVKKSIRDSLLAAKVAIIDPELTFSLPEKQTVYSGMDALVQAIEAYTSKSASPITDIYAYAAVERIAGSILKVFQDGHNAQARMDMAMGSLMAGIALSNARLGAVHGLAHPIGVRTGKPHGLICAVLLIPVMRFNLSVCFEKYAQITKALGLSYVGGDPIDGAAAGIKNIMIMQKRLGIPPHISDLGLNESDLPQIVEESLPSGSLKANPREANAEDLLNILRENF